MSIEIGCFHKVANLELVLILTHVCQNFQNFSFLDFHNSYKFMYVYTEINTYINITKFKNH